jgi:16S rRNA (cytosine967-C5)-methyltransferase
MRRRIDVRWRLQPEDFDKMPNEQLMIMRAVFRVLRPGGILVYSTCSIEPEENQDVVRRLEAELSALKLETKRDSLPFRDGFDGAFAAKLSSAGPF